jgi:hypothetical protein
MHSAVLSCISTTYVFAGCLQMLICFYFVEGKGRKEGKKKKKRSTKDDEACGAKHKQRKP